LKTDGTMPIHVQVQGHFGSFDLLLLPHAVLC